MTISGATNAQNQTLRLAHLVQLSFTLKLHLAFMVAALSSLMSYLITALLDLMEMTPNAVIAMTNTSSIHSTSVLNVVLITAMSVKMEGENAPYVKRDMLKARIRIRQTFKTISTAMVIRNTIDNIDCNSMSDGSVNLYPDCATCDLSSITEDSAVVGDCLACKNGYLHLGECVTICPRGYYGS